MLHQEHHKVADRVAILTALGIAITGLVVILIAVLPLQRLLKHDRKNDLVHLTEVRGILVDEYLSQALNLARHIGNSTQVKTELAAYHHGRISATELKDRTLPSLTNELLVIADMLVGASQYSLDGELLVVAGMPIPPDVHPGFPEPGSEEVLIDGPFPLLDRYVFIFSLNVFDANRTLVGRNAILFDANVLQNLLSHSGSLGITEEAVLIRNDHGVLEQFFPFGQSCEKRFGSGTLATLLMRAFSTENGVSKIKNTDGDDVYSSFWRLKNAPWSIVVNIDSNELYAAQTREYRGIVGTIFVLSILGLLGSMRMVRPLVLSLQRELTQRVESQEELRKSEQKFRSLFSEMLNGFAHHEIVTDDQGQPIDYTFVAVNAAFEKITGLRAWDILGKRLTQVMPGIKEDSVDWIGIYGKVALTGEPFSDELFSSVEHKWYNVHAYSSTPGFFSVTFEDISARKKAERELEMHHTLLEELVEDRTKALSAAKREWELTFDAVQDFISIHDPQGKILDANKALLDKLRLTKNELLGKECRDIFQCGLCGNECPHDKMFVHQTACHREGFSKTLGGHVIASYYPIFNDEGTYSGSVRIVKDMSEQKAAAEALMRQSALMESTFTAIPDSVVVTDLAGTITLCNRGFHKMFGYARQEVIGSKLSHLLGNDEAHLGEWMAKLQLKESPQHTPYEEEHRRKDGTVFPAENLTCAIKNKAGETNGFLTLIRDISERKKSQSELLAARERLDFALANAEVGFYEWDIANDKVTINPVLQRLLGETNARKTMSSNEWRKKIHPADKRKVYATLTAHFKGEIDQYSHEQRLLCHNSEYKWLWNVGRITDREVDGTPLQMVGICIDVSIHKELEEALTDAKEQAEKMDRAKSDFLANMSHEIRTPINAIIGISHLAMTSNLSPEQNSYIQKIDNAARLLLEVVDEVLDFSKVEAGKLDIEQIPFSLDQLLNTLKPVVEYNAKAKGLEIHFKVAADIPPNLIGDALRIKQVLVNLLSNAVKFTKEGEIVLAVDVVARHDDNLHLRFSVRDTGVGIDPERLSHLFEPFTQADTSITRNYGGTGLGLAISQRLVQLMGGVLKVESSVGGGSLFFFELAIQAEKGIERQDIAARLQVKRALLVDDNATPQAIISDMLKSFGIETVAVDSGQAAFDAVRLSDSGDTPFDIALIDWQMPQLDGIATARMIKSATLKAPPRLILLSAQDMTSVESNDELFDSYLAKPLTYSALFDCLSQAMARQEHIDPQTVPIKQWNHSNTQILLVEDNEINQQITGELLRRIGMTVAVADDGLVALERVRDERPDLILMDMQMPRMDGLTATREIRKLEGCDRESLPILALTAHAQEEEREHSLAAGMNAYLVKPIDPDILYATIYRWLAVEDCESVAPDIEATATPYMNKTAEVRPTAKLPATLPGLDIASALSRQGGDVEFMRRIMAKFTRHHARTVSDIGRALDRKDFASAGRLSHTLKSAGGYVGADRLCEIAKELEQACKAEKAEGCSDALACLTAEMEQVNRSIEYLTDAPVSQRAPSTAMAAPVSIELPGLDFDLGLKRTGGHRDLYLAQLNVFAEHYRNADEQEALQQAFVRRDYAEVARLAHNMKSMAGNLGAERLYDISAELEKEMRQQRTVNAESLLSSFSTELNLVLTSIETLR